MSKLFSKKDPIKWFIGIDVGVKTGIAIWNAKTKMFEKLTTLSILNAFDVVENHRIANDWSFEKTIVIIENPNKRKYFGDTGRERLQGAGSVKRDFSIWVEYCEKHGIQFEDVAPNRNGKMNAEPFKSITGFTGRTSNHARDAGMLVFGK